MPGQCHLAKLSQGHTVTAGARGPCYLLVITSQPVALLNSCLETGFRSRWTLAMAVQVGPWCSRSRALGCSHGIQFSSISSSFAGKTWTGPGEVPRAERAQWHLLSLGHSPTRGGS